MNDAGQTDDIGSNSPHPPVAAPEDIAKFAETARGVVSAEHVLPADAIDKVVMIRPQLVVRPGNERELASILKLANDAGLAVIPRGGGTKMDWGREPKRADVVVSMVQLNRIEEHAWADLTVTVEAGCNLRELQETLARHGQRLALDALWPERATVGGVLSTNDSGALRLRFGGLRDLVIGVTLALADGTLAKSGGKVVKNVAGYDLPKLVTGALGTLGVITRAVFRLHPAPRETRTVSCVVGDFVAAQRILLGIQDSSLAHSALQVRASGGAVETVKAAPSRRSPAAAGLATDSTPYCNAAIEVDVLFEATEAGLAAQVEQARGICGGAAVVDRRATVWNAREELFGDGGANRRESAYAVMKISVLPARVAESVELVARLCGSDMAWGAVVQATGIGCVRVEGDGVRVAAVATEFRALVERDGGSAAVLARSEGVAAIEAWGAGGDSLRLMRAVKQQFDPRGTLNPGRFVGGI